MQTVTEKLHTLMRLSCQKELYDGIMVPCAGYVPADKPGSLGYYTPQHAQDGVEDRSGRHPVIAALDQALTRDPQRHRTSSLSSSAGSGSIRASFARRTSFVPSASPIGSPAKVQKLPPFDCKNFQPVFYRKLV